MLKLLAKLFSRKSAEQAEAPYKVETPAPVVETPAPTIAEQATQAVVESIAPAKKKGPAKKPAAEKKPRKPKAPKQPKS